MMPELTDAKLEALLGLIFLQETQWPSEMPIKNGGVFLLIVQRTVICREDFAK